MSAEDSKVESWDIYRSSQQLDGLLDKIGAVSEVIEAKKKLRECVMWAIKALEVQQ